jgi:outer membrane protein
LFKESSIMGKSIRLNLLAAALAWACAPALVHAEDLVQIYTQARQADPTLAIADANKGAINEGIDQARSALLPQINASLAYDHVDGNTNTIGPVQDFNSGNFVLLPSNDTVRNRSRPTATTTRRRRTCSYAPRPRISAC